MHAPRLRAGRGARAVRPAPSEEGLVAWLRTLTGAARRGPRQMPRSATLIGDDAATLPSGAGRHGRPADRRRALPRRPRPGVVARRLLAVNLSDLAASGAAPTPRLSRPRRAARIRSPQLLPRPALRACDQPRRRARRRRSRGRSAASSSLDPARRPAPGRRDAGDAIAPAPANASGSVARSASRRSAASSFRRGARLARQPRRRCQQSLRPRDGCERPPLRARAPASAPDAAARARTLARRARPASRRRRDRRLRRTGQGPSPPRAPRAASAPDSTAPRCGRRRRRSFAELAEPLELDPARPRRKRRRGLRPAFHSASVSLTAAPVPGQADRYRDAAETAASHGGVRKGPPTRLPRLGSP